MKTFGFIGLGLIGGSIARAIREKMPTAKIIAYNRTLSALDEAFYDKVVDIPCAKIDDHFKECEMIFLCTPVQKNEEFLEMLIPYISEDCIITDVGSVKGSIHKCVEKLGLNSHFIGGHPMAGSERIGYSNSKASLLQNAFYAITPTPEVAPIKTLEYKMLVEKIGAIPIVLDYNQHDYTVAAISHLPHIIASSLVNLVRESDSNDGYMKTMAAGGFKDITRIASSSADMWQQICLTNTDNIRSLLRDYIVSLEKIDKDLEALSRENIYTMFDEARRYRDSFVVSTNNGPIIPSSIITVDIADEPGALAAIATILALNGLNLKNIGILHNREYQGGDLKIEFYSNEDMDKAKSILIGKGYTIHEKE